MSVAYVGVGGNRENPRKVVSAAIDALGRCEGMTLAARSSLYSSAPQDYLDQEDFVNAVARVETSLKPVEVLDTLQTLEARMGRRRDGPRFGPRLIDLDLLLYDDLRCCSERLELPHPRMHRRRFVLQPLVEIDPDAEIPGKGRADTLLAACASQRVTRIDVVDD